MHPTTWTSHHFFTSITIIANHKTASSSGSSIPHPRVFHSKLKCYLFKNSYPDSVTHLIIHPPTQSKWRPLFCPLWPFRNLTWAYHGLLFWQLVWFVAVLVNKLVPGAFGFEWSSRIPRILEFRDYDYIVMSSQTMFSGQSFLHRLSAVLGSGPDRTTSHFLIKTTLISFLAYYTECSLTKLFMYSRSLHYYCFTSILDFINIYCSRVAVCLPIVLSIKRIYHHCTRPNVL